MKTLIIAQRELSSFFYSPIAYVVMALFMVLAGMLFRPGFASGEPAEMRILFGATVWVLIGLAPAITMRLFAEEQRSGTIETLMTSPVTDAQVVIGKWLGALGFYALLLSPTLVCVVLLEIWGRPDYGPIVTGYIGLLLLGGLYLAIGTCASVLTRNQIIAFVITLVIILVLTVVTHFLQFLLPPSWGKAMLFLNVNHQYEAFAKGLIDFACVTYFVSGILLFLVIAAVGLHSRRWR